MARGQVRAGRAYVELLVRDNKLIKGLRNASKRLRSFGSSVQSSGVQLLRIGGALAAPLAIATKVFASFEKRMSRVKALLNANEADMAKLEAAAKEMGKTTVFSASQAAEAMQFFALAGFKTDQIMQALGPTLSLAASGQVEIAEAADIAAKVMAGMGIEASQLGHVVDVMAKAMTTANTDITQLGDAFKFVGPLAKAAGVSLEEITGAIQLLSNAGMGGEMAGSTLRGILLALSSPSKAASDELKRLGVEINDQQGNMRSLADIISDLENGLSGLGSGQKLNVLGKIFPARQAAGAAVLIEQGSRSLRDASSALRDSAGTASKIAETQLDNLTGDATIFFSVLESVALNMKEAFNGTLRTVVQAVTKITGTFSEWVKNNRGIVAATGAAVLAIIGLGTAFVGVGVAATLAGIILAGWASILSVVLSPIGLTIAAVVALGVVLVKYTSVGAKALEWLQKRFGWLADVALKSWNAIGKALASGDLALAAKVASTTLQVVWQSGLNALKQQWLDWKHFVLSLVTQTKFRLIKITADVWAGVQTGFVESVDFMADVWAIFTNQLTKVWFSTVGFIQKAWVKLKGLFDEDLNVNAEVERINNEVAANRSGADDDMLAAIGKRDRDRQQRKRQIEQQRKSDQAGLDALLGSEQDALDAGIQSQRANAEKAVQSALAAYRASIAEAGMKDLAGIGEPGASGPGAVPDLASIESSLQGGAASFDATANGNEAKGGFNAFALGGQGADSLSEKLNDAMNNVAENTAELVNKARTGRLVFTNK